VRGTNLELSRQSPPTTVGDNAGRLQTSSGTARGSPAACDEPGRQHSPQKAEEMRFPRNAGLSGQDAEHHASKGDQTHDRQRHGSEATLIPAGQEQRREPAEDQSARTQMNRVRSADGPCPQTRNEDRQDTGPPEDSRTSK